MKERIKWIDYGKAIAIFMVVWGHTGLYGPLHVARYMFGMPFFFFVSGYLFSFEKYSSYKNFFTHRVKQIIVPYLLFHFVTYFFWFFISRHYGDDAVGGHLTEWYVPLKGILLGYPELMVNDIPLWFMVCLFIVENMFYAYRKFMGKWWFPLWLVVAGYVMGEVMPRLPYCINTAFVAIIFYYFGYIFKQNNKLREKLTGWLPGIICIAVYSIIVYTNGKITMHTNGYGENVLLFITGQVACYVLMYNLCLMLQKNTQDIKFLSYMGRNTLIICAIHMIIFTLLKGVMVYILDLPLDMLRGNIVPNLIFAMVSVACCVPVIYIINRYMPFMIGKSLKPKSVNVG